MALHAAEAIGGLGALSQPVALWLGRRPYPEIHELQRELVEARARDEIADTLLLVEHEPVYTIGRGGNAGPMPAGVPVVEIERGGELTFHGPGQLVGYPIVDLRPRGKDVHRFLRDLEEWLIAAVARWGLAGGRREGRTGVWVGPRKIASLGVAVRRWVTWHGFALNVDVDLGFFRSVAPCGLDGRVMTSAAAEGVRGATVELAVRLVCETNPFWPEWSNVRRERAEDAQGESIAANS